MPKELQTQKEAIQTVKENNQEYYDLAIGFAEKWISERNSPFTSEDLSFDMYLVLGLPNEKRVLGAVMNHLRDKKLIKHNGFTRYKAKQGHGKPCNQWISILYSEKQAAKRKITHPELNFEEHE